MNPDVKIVAVEPYDSPLLSKGQAGPHKIQGIGANFVPKNFQKDLIDEIIPVKSDDAYATSRHLSQTEGLLVACRAFSSDDEANSLFNLVPHCFCFGQAAGTAAALAVQNGCSVRDLPYPQLKEALLSQNVILP